MIKKLNNRGYLLVEVIVSFVIAMGVAYFLAEITINLKDRQKDLDKEIQYNFDKSMMTKEVMDDYGKIKEITGSGTDYTVTLSNNTTKNLSISQSDGETTFNYGSYSKTFDKSLIISDINIDNDITNKILKVKLSAKSIYSDKDYGLNIIVAYTEVNYTPSNDIPDDSEIPVPSSNVYNISILDESGNTSTTVYSSNNKFYSDLGLGNEITGITVPVKSGYTFAGYYIANIGALTNYNLGIDEDEPFYQQYIYTQNDNKFNIYNETVGNSGYYCGFWMTNCDSLIMVTEIKQDTRDMGYYIKRGRSINITDQQLINSSGQFTNIGVNKDLSLIASWRRN